MREFVTCTTSIKLNFLDVASLWYSVKIMKLNFIVLFSIVLLLVGCRDSDKSENKQPPPAKQAGTPLQVHGCRRCHRDVQPDDHHDFACTKCHSGHPDGPTREEAHAGLIARPAHPDSMVRTCGQCHAQQVKNSERSLHFTLRNAVNLVRKHFGAQRDLNNLTEIPVTRQPTTGLQLADDMLRRRCLRCHVYSAGDDYPYTHRGTGCAACHMAFVNGKPQSHAMIRRPGDQQCLSCHYTNVVGADYYGRFEHDFNWEYRTPYTTRQPFIRPYGVEYHELAPDIHQQRGLSCIDCHGGPELMSSTGKNKLSCSTCHQWHPGNRPLPDNLTIENDAPVLMERQSGKKHPIPQLSNPAHTRYGRQVACQVCHAQWSFNDSTTYLLRSETDEFSPWERLTTQSSSEVETLLNNNLNIDAEELPPVMKDGITGREMPGIWYKGFTERRWEDMIIRRDRDGMIKVFRPALDLRLSAVDRNDNILFDNLSGKKPILLPYTPHTTGPAGLLYTNRFAGLIDQSPQAPTAQ